MVRKLFVILASLGLAAGCSTVGQSISPGPSRSMAVLPAVRWDITSSTSSSSFKRIAASNFFAGYPGANAPTYGYIHNPQGKRIEVPLHQTTFETNPNLQHDFQNGITGWDNGKMDGFYPGPGKQYLAYAYMDRSQITPYWDMANQYVLADAMFPTEFGGSYTGHLNLIAGTDALTPHHAEVNYPTRPNGCDAVPGTLSSYVNAARVVGRGNGPFPCFTQWNTMAEVLDSSGVSWKYYVNKLLHAGIWAPFESISYVRNGNDWTNNIIVPQTENSHGPRQWRPRRRQLGNAEPSRFRSSRCAQQPRAILGRVNRQCYRREQLLEFDRNRRALGRLGRMVR